MGVNLSETPSLPGPPQHSVRLMLLLVLATLLTTHLAPPPATAAAGQDVQELTTGDVDTWLDGLVPALLEAERIPGATVAVVSDGEIVTLRGFGAADRPRLVPGATPVDPAHHLFRVGSVAKLFTATAVMQQVERGALDLDADVRQHLDFDLELPRGEVTLRHLLSHTAGFEERADHVITPDVEKVRDLRTELAQDPPHQIFAPGTTPAYSNYGNALAGYVVERVTGVPFADYVDAEILDPLGMDSTSLQQPLPPALNERMVDGFPAPDAEPALFEYMSVPPAGAASSTAQDMAAFMNFHLGHGPDGVLNPEGMATMHAPALPPESLGGLAAAEQMTLGFRDHEMHGQRVLSHSGDTTIFHSELALFPETDTGVFVSLNGNGARGISTAVLRQQLIDQFARRYIAPPAQTAPEPPPGAAERAAAVEGFYRSERRAESSVLALYGTLPIVTVTAGPDGTIIAGYRSFPKAIMQEIEPWLWRETGGTATLAVRTDDAGTVRDIALNAYSTEGRVSAWQGYYAQHLVLLAALVVLVVTLVAWPVNRLRRRRRWGADRPGARRVRRLAYAAPALVLLGLVLVVSSVQPEDYTLIRPLTRLGQVVLLLGVLGVIPAAWHLLNTIRHCAGVIAVTGAALLTLALGYVAGYSVVYRILWPDLSI